MDRKKIKLSKPLWALIVFVLLSAVVVAVTTITDTGITSDSGTITTISSSNVNNIFYVDSTSELQSTIDSCSSGCKIIIERGTYDFSGVQVNVSNSDINIVGAGKSTILNNINLEVSEDSDNVLIRDLYLQSDTGRVLDVRSTDNVIVSNNYLTGGNDACVFANGTENLMIVNNHLNNCSYGIHIIGSNNLLIDENSIINSNGDAIQYAVSDNRSYGFAIISNNIIRGVSTGGSAGGIDVREYGGNLTHVEVVDNIVENFLNKGIKVEGDYSTISGNVVSNSTSGSHPLITTTGQYNLISSNILYGVDNSPAGIQSSYNGNAYITISGNQVYNVTRGIISFDTNLISNYVTVSDNIIIDTTNEGVYFKGNNIKIDGNIIRYTAGINGYNSDDSQYLNNQVLNSTSIGILVKGGSITSNNIVADGSNSGIKINSGNNAIILGNQLSGNVNDTINQDTGTGHQVAYNTGQ